MENMFTSAMELLQKGVGALGAVLAIFGLVTLGKSIKDSNGPGIAAGISEIIGGGIIVLAAVMFGDVSL